MDWGVGGLDVEVRRIQDRMASIFLTPKQDEAENTQTEPTGRCKMTYVHVLSLFQKSPRTAPTSSLGNVRVTCPGKERVGPTSWTECWSPGWPAHKAKGSGPCHSMQQRKITQDVRWGLHRPAGRQNKLRLQDPSRLRRSIGSLWVAAPNTLGPTSSHLITGPKGLGASVSGPPPALLSVNTEGLCPHSHSLPSDLLA